jgi:hypothetical protein
MLQPVKTLQVFTFYLEKHFECILNGQPKPVTPNPQPAYCAFAKLVPPCSDAGAMAQASKASATRGRRSKAGRQARNMPTGRQARNP